MNELQKLIQRGARVELRSARRRGACGCGSRQSRDHRADQFPNIGVSGNITTTRSSADGAFPTSSGLRSTTNIRQPGAQSSLVRSRYLGPAAPRDGSGAGGLARHRRESQGRGHDARQRRRRRLLQPARTGHGAGDCRAHVDHSRGFVEADSEIGKRAASRRCWRFGRASSWFTRRSRSSRISSNRSSRRRTRSACCSAETPGRLRAAAR